MKKGNVEQKKKSLRSKQKLVITKEMYALCKETIPVHHLQEGDVVSASQLRAVYPGFSAIMKNRRLLQDCVNLRLTEEEALQLGVQIMGNPKLGVRMFTEADCLSILEKLEEKAQPEFAGIIRCIFHKEEVHAMLYPEETKPEMKAEEVSSADAVSQESAVSSKELEQLLQTQIEVIQAQTAEQKRIADTLALLHGTLAELVELAKAKPADSAMVSEEPPKPVCETKPFVTLKLKRKEKDPVYKKNPTEIQKFKDAVLDGIPNAMHNSVLHSAYNRMRDVYGVPVDTYQNEYFADTGKMAQSGIEIVHWLEFRNVAIRGLLRCCVQTVMKEGTAKE